MAASTAAVPKLSGGGDRQFGRRSVVDCGLVTVEMSPAGFGLMVNACEQGIGVYTLTTLERGQQVQILFHVPGSPLRVEGLGEVTWAGNSHAGLRLKQFKPSSEAPYKKWIASLPEPAKVEDPIAQRRRKFSDAVERLRDEITGANLSEDGALSLLVERMMDLTQANGAAIAIGDSQHMVCLATAGLAPEVGVRISSTNGLTGACIRNAKMIYCEDTESDNRVDRDICQQLNMRSSLMVPIMREQAMVGVLEAFSPKTQGFSAEHIRLVQELADLAAIVIFGNESPTSVKEEKDIRARVGASEGERSLDTLEPVIDDPVQVPRIEHRELMELVDSPSRWGGYLHAIFNQKLLIVSGLILLMIAGLEWRIRHVKVTNNTAVATESAMESAPAASSEGSRTSDAPIETATAVASPSTNTGSGTVVRPIRGVINMIASKPVPISDDGATAASSDAISGGAPFYPQAQPEYPDGARRERVQGDVVLQAKITKSGAVDDVGLLSGDAVLGAAAIKAVRQWKYEPLLSAGTPTEAHFSVTLQFRLTNAPEESE